MLDFGIGDDAAATEMRGRANRTASVLIFMSDVFVLFVIFGFFTLRVCLFIDRGFLDCCIDFFCCRCCLY